jgi:hypothetical protein
VIDALRFVKRPAPGAGLRALALYVGPALLLIGTVLPALLLWNHMTRYLGQPHHPTHFVSPVTVLVYGAGLLSGWVTVLVIHLSLRGTSRRELWGLWVPLLYAVGGCAIAVTMVDLVLLVWQPFRGTPDEGGPAWWAFTWAVIAACASVGVQVGRRAGATEPPPRPANRAIWIAEVDAGRSWWLLQALAPLAIVLPVSGALLLAGNPSGALEVAVSVLATVGVLAIWGSRSAVTISPAGIRVGHGHIRLFGWELGIDGIASVEVADVRLLRSPALWLNCWTNIAMRDGPALVVRTRWGTRRVLTLPDADDAAAMLGRWLAERRQDAGRST